MVRARAGRDVRAGREHRAHRSRWPEWGAAGVGQSSWGPAVYGIVAGDDAAAHLADRVRNALNERGEVYVNQFADSGARVTVRDPSAARG